MEKFLHITIFILIINLTKSNYIKLDFYKNIYSIPYDIESVFYSSISTDVYIGNPPKKISIQISTDTPYFVIQGNSLNDKGYSQEKSSSFFFIKYGHSYSYRNIYFHSIFFSENFEFNDDKDIILNAMMCWGKYPITNNDGILGLQLKDIKFNEKNIFINQLQEKNIISKNIISLIYKNEKKGELILGEYPQNKTRILKNKKYKFCDNNFKTNGELYGTMFDNIYSTENFSEKNLIIFSNIFYGFIGSSEYNNFIYKFFFKEKMGNKNCWIQTIEDDKYFGYVCSKNIDMNKIPDIKLYHKELNHTFEIKNEEMWISRNNIKYFLIFFSFQNQYSWTLGQKFLQKYPFVFDMENNILGIYYNDMNEKINNNYFRFFLFVFIIILIVISLFIRFMCIYKKKETINKDEIELNLIENNNL